MGKLPSAKGVVQLPTTYIFTLPVVSAVYEPATAKRSGGLAKAARRLNPFTALCRRRLVD